MSWRSPKSAFNEFWEYKPSAYDDNINSSAHCGLFSGWNDPLVLFVSASAWGQEYILSDKIRIRLFNDAGSNIDQMRVTINWQEDEQLQVYEGVLPPDNTWMDIAFGGAYRICNVGISFHNQGSPGSYIFIYEVDFNQLAVRPLVNGSLGENSLVGEGLVR